MNPEFLFLRALARPELSPELRGYVVDYLSGDRSVELRRKVIRTVKETILDQRVFRVLYWHALNLSYDPNALRFLNGHLSDLERQSPAPE